MARGAEIAGPRRAASGVYPGFFGGGAGGGGGLLATHHGGAGVTPLSSGLFPLTFSHGGEFGTCTMFHSFGFGSGMNSTISTVSTGIRIAASPAAVKTPSSVSH